MYTTVGVDDLGNLPANVLARLTETLVSLDGTPRTIKPVGDTKAGTLDWKIDSASGYLLHFRAGGNSGVGSGVIAIGNDEGHATGLVISHKNDAYAASIVQNPGSGPGLLLTAWSASQAPLIADIKATGGSVQIVANTGGGYADGVATSGSTTLTSATAAFVSGDVGKAIKQLTQVGSQAACIPDGTTIVSVESGTSVTLSAAAIGTATGIRFSVAGRMPTSGKNLVRFLDYDSSALGVVARDAFTWSRKLEVLNFDAAGVAVQVKGAAAQTGDAFRVFAKSGNGTPDLAVEAAGRTAARAAIYVSNVGNVGASPLYIQNLSTSLPSLQIKMQNGATAPAFAVNNFSDAPVFRIAADGRIYNVAANEAATATAGTATLPANPVGFFFIKNSSGTDMKVPYYAV